MEKNVFYESVLACTVMQLTAKHVVMLITFAKILNVILKDKNF